MGGKWVCCEQRMANISHIILFACLIRALLTSRKFLSYTYECCFKLNEVFNGRKNTVNRYRGCQEAVRCPAVVEWCKVNWAITNTE